MKFDRDYWKERLPFITAFANGEQVYNGNMNLSQPMFESDVAGYHIAPKPTAANYLKGMKECGLKAGDRVKVVRQADFGERGWQAGWSFKMDDAVGKIHDVIGEFSWGFQLNNFSRFSFPYFVLEKVSPTFRPFATAAEFEPHSDKKIKRKCCSESWYRAVGAGVEGISLSQSIVDWKPLFDEYEFADGTPCGVEAK